MAVIKCKMCGGDLVLQPGSTVAECEYCGTVQTVPTADNEKKMTLFQRANRLRFGCEFDKAAGVYEAIVADFPEEAEAYWGLVLCKYGIEYVDDPATGKKIPTCHRSSFDSVMDDPNLDMALENADAVARRVYRDEAKAIEELRKGIVEVSSKEAPYDIFICYKETDEHGGRTLDSVLAQDVYDALVEKGYRVFFSRITLEDKLGQAYEPYIFAALHSAKIMLAFGTDYEYFNAVWVKNEWSRFLSLIASGEKKTLIPCYKGIDAYDMPKEFAKLQAQDMGKVGAIQDLLRGIEKVMGKSAAPAPPPAQAPASGAEALVLRGQFALEDRDWKKADEFFDRALDMEPRYSRAYVGKFLAKLQLSRLAEVNGYLVNVEKDKYFSRAMQFAAGAERAELEGVLETARKAWQFKLLNDALKKHIRNLNDQERRRQQEEERRRREEEQRRQREEAAAEQKAKEDQFTLAKKRVALAKKLFVKVEDYNGECMYALCADGRVVSTRNDVDDWQEITKIVGSPYGVVGLRADGTVVTTDKRFNVSSWQNIVDIYTDARYVYGEKADGTYEYAAGSGSQEPDLQRAKATRNWDEQNVLRVKLTKNLSCSEDGTIRYRGEDKKLYHFVDSDGTTVVLHASGGVTDLYGDTDHLPRENIVALFRIKDDILCLRSDGVVLSHHVRGNCSTETGWRLFQSIDTLEEEMAQSAEKNRVRLIEEARRAAAERQEYLYQDSCKTMGETTSLTTYRNLLKEFESYGTYKDCQKRAEQCREKIQELEEEQRQQEAAREKARAEAAAKKKKRNIILSCVAAVVVAIVVLMTQVVIPAQNYKKAGVLLQEGKIWEAAVTYYKLGGYRDAREQSFTAWDKIADRSILTTEYHYTVAVKTDGTVVAAGDLRERYGVPSWDDIVSVSAGPSHVAGLKADGTVVAAGRNKYGECNVSDWKDIVSVSTGSYQTVGLKADGSVVAVGKNEDGEGNVSNWNNIVAISATLDHTVGLKADGTVVAVGDNEYGQCNVSDWSDIVAISAASNLTVGLKADGTVVAVGDNEYGECDVDNWNNIVEISAAFRQTIGLKADGSVVAVGDNKYGECNVFDWTDIVAISATGMNTVGLKTDGTVVATGRNENGECNVSGWDNIVAIFPEGGHTVGLKADGTVVAVGSNDDGQCDISNWTNIKLPN